MGDKKKVGPVGAAVTGVAFAGALLLAMAVAGAVAGIFWTCVSFGFKLTAVL